MTYKKIVINCETGITEELDMTPDEIAAYETSVAAQEQFRIEREAAEMARVALKESAKAKLVAGQPLTEEEAATIVL